MLSEHIKTLDDILQNRRSIFPPMYTDRDISNDTLLAILENARWAPTHKMTQPWKFMVFKSVEARKNLSDYLANYYVSHTSKEEFSEIKYRKTMKKPLQSGAVMVIIMVRDPEERVPEWEEIAAVAMAVQNMWLSCHVRGIGAYWSSPKSIIEARDFLDLSPNERCLGLFYMGYCDEEVLAKPRKKLEEFVHVIE